MTSATVRAEVDRLLAILGPRWEAKAQPLILTCPDWATIQINSGTADLAARMNLVDAAAHWLGIGAFPTSYGSAPGYWGTYGTPQSIDEAGDFNGIPMVISTLLTAAEMDIEVAAR